MIERNRVVVRAPAKVNLTLDITGTLEGGYHSLSTVMHAVGLWDLLLIGRRPGGEIRVTCSQPGIPEDESNIAHKAARLFLESTGFAGQGVSIHIHKTIPSQAGMGGGSADGAGVLVGLNDLLQTRLTVERLCAMGERIGADVPFCIAGGCALAEGKGEILSPLPPLAEGFLLIAKPGQGVSTVEAYRQYDAFGGAILRPDNGAAVDAVRRGSLEALGAQMRNVFEQVAPLPDTEHLKSIMGRQGAVGAALTGSGSAVAGLFFRREQAESCLPYIRDLADAWVVEPVSAGAEIVFRD